MIPIKVKFKERLSTVTRALASKGGELYEKFTSDYAEPSTHKEQGFIVRRSKELDAFLYENKDFVENLVDIENVESDNLMFEFPTVARASFEEFERGKLASSILKEPKTLTSSWYDMSEEDFLTLLPLVAINKNDRNLINYPSNLPTLIKKMLLGRNPNDPIFVQDKNLIWQCKDMLSMTSMASFKAFVSTNSDIKVTQGAKALMRLMMSLNGFKTINKNICDEYMISTWLEEKDLPISQHHELKELVSEIITGFTENMVLSRRIVSNYEQVVRQIKVQMPELHDQIRALCKRELGVVSMSLQELIGSELRTATVEYDEETIVKKKTVIVKAKKVMKVFPKVVIHVKMSAEELIELKEINKTINEHVNGSLEHVPLEDRRKVIRQKLNTSYEEVEKYSIPLRLRKKEIKAKATEMQVADGKEPRPIERTYYEKASAAYVVDGNCLKVVTM